MAFYPLSYLETRQLPLKTFWGLNKNIDRISAERDLRQAMVGIRSQSSEGVKEMMTDLRGQMGTVYEIDERAEAANTVRTSREELRRIARIGDLKNNVYPR
jgi:hypothetical protein